MGLSFKKRRNGWVLTATTIYAVKSSDGEAEYEQQGEQGDQALDLVIATHPWSLIIFTLT